MRFEMIPIAYPAGDFAWSLGLPGATTPLDTVGASEVRVVDDATGDALQLAPGKKITLTIPTTAAQATPANLAAAWFDVTDGTWNNEATATIAATKQTTTVPVIDVTVSQPSWWAVTSSQPAAGGCIAGKMTAGGGPAAGVLVHGYGTNWFGSTTGLTDATGAFCLDVKATSNVTVTAGAASPTGLFAGTSALSVPSSASGSCAAGVAACAQAGTIDLPRVGTSCTSGFITDSNNTDGGLSTLGLWLENIPITLAENQTGLHPFAYVNQTTLGVGGTFCATVPNGSSFRFHDPTNDPAGCGNFAASAPKGGSQAPLTSPEGGVGFGSACGAAGGCADAGEIFYGCY
jgi:hypothetical protein